MGGEVARGREIKKKEREKNKKKKKKKTKRKERNAQMVVISVIKDTPFKYKVVARLFTGRRTQKPKTRRNLRNLLPLISSHNND